jgi:hypothetical protein
LDPSTSPDRPSAPTAARTPEIGIQKAVVGSLVVTWALILIPGIWSPEPAEPLVLAWLRLAAEHPLRLGTAVALVLWALGRRARPNAPSGKKGADELSS